MDQRFGQPFGRPTKFVAPAEIEASDDQTVTIPRRDYEKIRAALTSALAMLEMSGGDFVKQPDER